jgi:hypothetical protein
VRDATVPVFVVTPSLAKNANVAGGKSAARRGATSGSRTVALNAAQLSQETALSRDIVTSALRELFVNLADRIRQGQNVQMIFPGLGKLLSRADKLHFRFTPALVESISGGQPVNARLAHRMLSTNARGRYLATEGIASVTGGGGGGGGGYSNNQSQSYAQSQAQSQSYARYESGGGGGGGGAMAMASGGGTRHRERSIRGSSRRASASMRATSGAYETSAGAVGGLSLTGQRPASSASSRFGGAVATRELSGGAGASFRATGGGARRASAASGGSGAYAAKCGHELSGGAAQHASGLCKMCREREQVLVAKRAAAARERQLDRERAEADAMRAAEMDAEDRRKESERAQARREDAEFNMRVLHARQAEKRGGLRVVEMGSLFEKRQEAAGGASREQVRGELDEQVRIKRDREAEMRRRDLEADRLSSEAAQASMLADERQRAMRRDEQRARAREDLQSQMRSKAEAVPRSYDATDTGFTASEGPEQIAARKRRALELQAEQRALIAARAEARRFDKRAEADYSIKESLRTRAVLDREAQLEHSKRSAIKGDLRAAWDEQISSKARARDLERYGQEKGLTSLALPDMEEDDDDNCVRCGGPMPDGIRIKVPNRVHAGLKA